ncbi:MAG: nucleoside deaminase [Alphaproteobacteria bacterium]|nr:nucleoside deaminase [Alphaproteobacteria bacterium]
MNEYMKTAIELSEDNLKTNAGGPFGAVVVKDGKIIGRGSNHVLKNNDPTAHAEIMAIRDACKNIKSYDLSGCELYTSCYPCPMCLSAIIWANIKTVYYGNTKEDAANIGFRDDFIYDYLKTLTANKPNTKILKLKSLGRSEAIKVFTDFANKKDKTIY